MSPIKNDLKTALHHWLTDLNTQSVFAPQTLKNYAQDLKRFCRYADQHQWSFASDLSTAGLKQFLSDQYAEGLSPKSIARQYASLKAFLSYLVKHHGLPAETGQGIKTPKLAKKLPPLLEIEELQSLLQHAPTDFLSARDFAILELLYSSGLRVSELQQLNEVDLLKDEGMVRVLGKGQKERLVPVGAKAWQALATYHEFRRTLPEIPSTKALFVTTKGQRITQRTIQLRIKTLGKKIGKNIHPHLLRHCFASHLLSASQNLRAVQEMLGHASLNSTEIYTHLDLMQLTKIYDNCHPRAQNKTGKK